MTQDITEYTSDDEISTQNLVTKTLSDCQSVNMYHFTVLQKNNGGRLDKCITEHIPELSRGKVKNLCLDEQVMVNDTLITDPAVKVKISQQITVTIPIETADTPTAEQIPLDILFEDDDLIIVNKPFNMTVHPAAGTPNGTLVNALLHHTNGQLSTLGTADRPGIVHRLDKDTSGIMVVAKNNPTHEHLAQQFFDHSNKRVYYAIIRGCPKQKSGTIKAFIGRNRHDRKKMAIVGSGGKMAITHWKVLETVQNKNVTILALIECTLETGRTHQIRVHTAHIGHPIIGDTVYGGHDKGLYKYFPKETLERIKDFPRQALHATTLGIIHPKTNEYLEFNTSPPSDFCDLANDCGFEYFKD